MSKSVVPSAILGQDSQACCNPDLEVYYGQADCEPGVPITNKQSCP